MDLLWPRFLFLLGIIPLLVAAYIWVLRRRRRFAVRYSSLALVREALPNQSRLRRHLPFALFLCAVAFLVFAMGRPAAVVSLPSNQTTVIIAIDVSGSMRSRDIQPSRLEAAQAAALSFVQRQKSSTQIGIVAFSSFGELIQPPTTDQEALQTAIQSLTLGRRTAIGSGILKSLDAIAEVDKSVLPSVTDASQGVVEPTPPPHGAYVPDIIVLLTDGVSNTGPEPIDAAQQALDRGVRVYTIGIGTDNGAIPFGDLLNRQGNNGQGNGRSGGFGGRGSGGDPYQNGQQYGGNSYYGGWFRTGIDEATLKQVADMTGGTYNSVSSADQLLKVFRDLPTYLISKHVTTEISVVFTAFGALFAALAIGLSMLWRPLP